MAGVRTFAHKFFMRTNDSSPKLILVVFLTLGGCVHPEEYMEKP